ncbi:MAG TPA: hypothetical protein VNN18_07040 [Candidatus Xenobia bacterium]|nr:hypothetical protein [Candidatus Xenobia bacterium]
MTEVYRTEPLAGAGESGTALVIHCSDPRYQVHFHEFLRLGLGLERYGLLVVPGGAQFLTLADYLPKFSWAGWRWVKFIGDIAPPTRVVLIAHDDCLWYRHVRGRQDNAAMREKQVADLRRVGEALRERLGELKVELYYARLVDAAASFEAVK